MSYITTVYVEGGAHDAETFACGPFATLREAEDAAEALSDVGTAQEHFLFANADVVRRQL